MLATWAPRQPKIAWSGSPTTKTLPCNQAATGLFHSDLHGLGGMEPLTMVKALVTWSAASKEGRLARVGLSLYRRKEMQLIARHAGQAPYLLPSQLLNELKLGGVCVLQSRLVVSRTQSWHVQRWTVMPSCKLPGLHSSRVAY